MKFDKALTNMALVYMPIWEYNQWGINNITCKILTLGYPCDTDFINYALDIKGILQNDNQFDDDCHITTADT